MSVAKDVNLDRVQSKPFVKWVGGKGQLLPELLARVPNNFDRYYEPFVGGGALFFGLQPAPAYLSDINAELINTYCVIRDKVEALITNLSKHHYDKEYFYTIRNVDRFSQKFSRWSDVQKASRLIFLNKTCFNGLYRVNSRGEFNVPFGRYVNPTICNAANLRACSQILQGAHLEVSDFQKVVELAKQGDFVYFDPPYAPLNATSNFTSYAKDGFGLESQVLLRDVCKQLNSKKVKFMLSNSSAPLVLDLYQDFHVEFVKATRAINSKSDRRGAIDEVIVRNY